MSGLSVAASVAGAGVSGGIGAASSGKGKKSPTPPNPYVTASKQFDLNKQASNFDANQNRYDTYQPGGKVTWTNWGNADTPKWVQNTDLKPENQRLYDQQLGNQNTFASQVQNEAPGFFNALHSTARPIDNTTFNQVAKSQLDRMTPGLDHATQMLQTQLANQGLAPGGDAYRMGMLSDSQGRNDAYLAAVNSAMDAQTQENNMVNANQSQNNQNQGQAIQNMSTLLGGQGSVDMPSFGGNTAVGQVGVPDLQGLITGNYANQVGQNNAQKASKNQVGSAAGGLGSGVEKGLLNSKGFQGLFK
jgi:hypothetical protein